MPADPDPGPGGPPAGAAGARAALRVGNDVVDLADPRCRGRSGDRRFLERILSPEEAREVRSATAPDTLLWVFWAAKEAAYKVVSKVLGAPPPFVHARFRVGLEPPGRAASGEAAEAPLAGTVAWDDLLLPLRAWVRPERVHAVAWQSGAGAPVEPFEPVALPRAITLGLATLPDEPSADWRRELSHRFTPREWAAVHAQASAIVRLEARAELARRLRAPEEALEVVCPGDVAGRTPPEVFLDGRRAPADVSLSHHGRFVAWAVAVPE